ncbi:unnamed protein product, partial [Cuscuta epithymum]
MEGLRVEDGRWETDRAEVAKQIGDYFNNLFTAGNSGADVVYDCVQRRISESHNLVLLGPVRSEEVKEAAFDMFPDKSPGLDGFGPGFYQHFWDVIGQDIVDFCRKNFESDDSLLFFRASHDEASLIKETLADYEKASGQ